MSLLKLGGIQIGQSNTASNNFHWRNLLDGLLRLSRGNAGDASPTDVMRVKPDNSVEFPGGITGMESSLAASGWQKLPSGLIIQWGELASMGANTTQIVTLPVAYTSFYKNFVSYSNDSSVGTLGESPGSARTSMTQLSIGNGCNAVESVSWLTIGK